MEIRSDTADQLTGLAELLAQQVMETLLKHYPAYKSGWTVVVNEKGGVVHIMNLLISTKMGFTVLMSSLVSDPMMKTVMRGAGEYLERYRQSRERVINVDHALADMPRNWLHEPVADL